jgi:hypothetical protein
MKGNENPSGFAGGSLLRAGFGGRGPSKASEITFVGISAERELY